MILGLLQCDHVDEAFRHVSGDYDAMFRALFAGTDAGLRVYDAVAGELPGDLGECDAYLTTGSRRSVYEDEPWIARLGGLVRELDAAGRPFVGICFGMQLMATALGGRVARSARGWGVGVRSATVEAREGWMEPPADEVRLIVSHRDQVEMLPPGAVVLGGNDHCPVSILRIGERLLGFQGHPEFTPAYAAALLESRRDRLGAEAVDAALRTLAGPTDAGVVARWILRFVAGAA